MSILRRLHLTQKADIYLRSTAVFTYPNDRPFDGFVAIRGNRILAVGSGDGQQYVDGSTKVYNLGAKLICPGFVDTHCFFTGYLLTQSGVDLSACTDLAGLLHMAKAYSESLQPGEPVLLGRAVRADLPQPTESQLDGLFDGKPVILFLDGTCWMNEAAKARYAFTPETCWSESYWRLLRDILGNQAKSVPAYGQYHAMLHARGVTSTKEMGFDDFYGFTDVLEGLEKNQKLAMRVHFMSQPVGALMNLAFGQKMRARFQGDFVRFSGYNQMTDGSISQMEGEMKQPYEGTDILCAKKIDWAGLEKDALAADTQAFRFSLHAQGDRAIAKTLDIFEKCTRDDSGKLVNRHAMTDLECSDPIDLERMGRLGVVAEVYPQIMSIADRESKVAMIQDKIGLERGKNYWNRRKMLDSGVVLSCATDLPLVIDDIPESVYHSVGGRFPEGGEPFNPGNTISLAELLTAWTYGGQYNLQSEDELGSLEAGKLADIAVVDTNLFDMPVEEVRQAKVCLTIVDGKVVFSSLED
jgi:predicted amidohydrolase YtcJ